MTAVPGEPLTEEPRMLADVIHKVAQATQDDEQPYHPRPSMASPSRPDDPGRCIRQMVYHRLDTPAAPLPGRVLLVFDDGRTHEDLTIKWLEKAAVTVYGRQLPVDILLPHPIGEGFVCTVCGEFIPPDRMHGHIDALVDDLLGVTRLLELKAINHFSFQEALAGVPPMDYIVQCCAYLRGLQQAGHNIREAILLIKNKNTAQYVEFRIQYDAVRDSVTILEVIASEGTYHASGEVFEGVFTGAVTKFEAVEAYAASHALPTRPYRADSWRCSYCRWGTLCWSGYDQEVAARTPAATFDGELAALLADYYAASRTKSQAEVTTKRLRPVILGALEAAGAKSGLGGNHVAKVLLQHREILDEDLIPAPIRRAATIPKTVEILKVDVLKVPPRGQPALTP
jgi:hypothetical protein